MSRMIPRILARRALVGALLVGLSLTLPACGTTGERPSPPESNPTSEPAATTGGHTTGVATTTAAPKPEPPPVSTRSAAPPTTPIPPPPTPPKSAIPPSLLGTEWDVLPTSAKVVALTFDCGANADGVPSILHTLRRSKTPATFFLTGRWATTYPDLARVLGARFAIGNHTFDHPDLTRLGPAAVRSELKRAEAAIRATTGRDPRPLFRFPYGARDARTISVVNDLGYGSIRWTVDTLGWKGMSGGQSVGSVRERVLTAQRAGAIILMHVGSAPDGSTLDAAALPSLIAAIETRGYRFVDLTAFVR
jgi:peptidoglycan/xylan/chitin deacetylase (PgdA/CDA1 family)